VHIVSGVKQFQTSYAHCFWSEETPDVIWTLFWCDETPDLMCTLFWSELQASCFTLFLE